MLCLPDICLPVILFVCLSLSLLATSHKIYWSDLHESFSKDVSLDKEELTKFLKLSVLGSRSRIF